MRVKRTISSQHETTEDFCHSTNRRVSIRLLLPSRTFSNPRLDADGPAHQRYLPSTGESIYRCVYEPSWSMECIQTKSAITAYQPMSVIHAYKSRQSRIPREGLSDRELDGKVQRILCDARSLRPCEGTFTPMHSWGNPACKWSAFIVSKEHRMNM